ncbi:hypothetical protein [Moraxella lacunata]|uniref:hypothetical protein n=1 Tax=Moraxella lacunata TaxID=477 RepID=UPI003EE05D95
MGFLFYNHLNSKYTTKGHGKHAPTKVFFKIWHWCKLGLICYKKWGDITPLFIALFL